MTELRDRLQTTLGGGYRVTDELAGGGMSRVFVAEETELGRAVVVKVLPPDLGAGLNVDRFRREIQLAARLQHPHIVPLLSAGAREGLLFYTMPLIEGQTLRARLARSGELPIPEALRVLRDVADALEYAHAHGVVHRDIKPENVLISGHHALVTDFGVSKALSSATGEQSLTSIGVALGTPTYMSPEQATADPMMDHRTDIYALGILGYELLTGHPPFSGGTPQQVLAAQVTQTPEPITKHRPHVPPQLDAIVMRCLEKKPADRWQAAHEVRAQLEALATPSGGTVPITAATIEAQRTARWVKREIVLGSVAAAVLLIALLASRYFGDGDRIAFAIGATYQVTNAPGIEITPALSPDGRLVAYAAGHPGMTRIYVRQLPQGRAIAVADGVPGNQRAPVWSPDGSQIAFVGADGAYTVPSLGGVAQRVIEHPRRQAAGGSLPPGLGGLAWTHDGNRLVYTDGAAAVFVVATDGTGRRKVADARFPHSPVWSPDNSRIAFVAENPMFVFGEMGWFGNLAPASIWIVPAAGGQPLRISDDIHLNTSPAWLPDGRGIVYVSTLRGGRDVFYQRVDRNGSPAGEPVRLTTGLNAHSVSVAADGTRLTYATLSSSSTLWHTPVPTRGPATADAARQLTFGNEIIEVPGISPDGRWVAFDSDRAGNSDIWKVPLAGGEPVQLTRDPADEFAPQWSPDGGRISFHTWRGGTRDLMVMNADGSSPVELAGGPKHEYAGSWSPDGRLIAFPSDRGGRFEIFIVPSSGGAPRQVTTNRGELRVAWSPDGKWIAYLRGEEVWVVDPVTRRELFLASSANLAGRTVTDVGGWSKDSRWAHIRAVGADGRIHIWAASPYGEPPRPVVLFNRADRQSYRSQFTSNGTTLVFTIGKHESDIWVADLVKR